MKKGFGLNRTQLKIIAIISMVIDHFAWGFVDFYSPLGQFLHVCGRLTVPIMCFFIAEGYRKTSDIKKYIHRMAVFAIISIIPFYIFFHEEYGFRQNIIFDLMLGLILLTVLECKRLPKWGKVLIAIALFATSAIIGGWVITPMLFILAFYYGKTFKQKAFWFIIADVSTVIFLMIAIVLNSRFHFSHYDWVWWDKSYLLGFMLALPLLRLYNGEKGKNFGGRYFFYLFYPGHFLILSLGKYFVSGVITVWSLYLTLHVVSLVIVLVITFLTAYGKPSRGQASLLIVEFGVIIYILGFMLEILSNTAEGVHFACIVEYLGEYILFTAQIFFISVLTGKRAPKFVYAICAVVSLIFLYLLVKTRTTGLFYKEIGVDFSGPFSKPYLVYGIGFYLSIVYIFSISVVSCVFCILKYQNGTKVEKSRLLYVLVSVIFCWLPFAIKLTGITHGYEIPGLGIILASSCMYISVYKMGFLDSVIIAGTNALDHSLEGILVVDTNYVLKYQNKQIEGIFGKLPTGRSLIDHEILGPVFRDEKHTIDVGDRVYDFVQEALTERECTQGHMLWVIDSTEHYKTVEKIHELAIRDALTGLYNRNYFQKLVEKDIDAGLSGTMIMIDMDNFKSVNDNNGHQCGDAILMALATVMAGFTDEVLYSGRIGGDEFCGFLRGIVDEKEIAEKLTKLSGDFERTVESIGYKDVTSLSIGAVPSNKVEKKTFKALYSEADKVLYKAKTAGKRRFEIK
jgi:diguanylate cyclase (GGDEF)-like protein